jgi:hypothetical protein
MVPLPTEANAADDPADASALRDFAARLLDAVVAALPGWVERTVEERYRQWAQAAPPDAVRAAAHDAGRAAIGTVEPALRELLAADVGAQRTNPLAIIRGAVVHPTAVLRSVGVPPVERDAHAEALFPDDVYDLSPASFADLDPSVHEPGLLWGAAKAHVILRRRRHP